MKAKQGILLNHLTPIKLEKKQRQRKGAIYIKRHSGNYLYLSAELCKLLNSEYVQVLTNRECSQIALIGCKQSDESAIKLTNVKECRGKRINWYSVRSLFLIGKTYEGRYIKKYKCVFFNLRSKKHE